MSVMDPGNLSDAEIQRSLGSLRRVGAMPGRGIGRGVARIKNRPRKPYKGPLDLPNKSNLNTTIEIKVKLPAYLVAASGLVASERDQFIREAITEKLTREGKTWWQPRFMAVVQARRIQANERFTAKSRLE